MTPTNYLAVPVQDLPGCARRAARRAAADRAGRPPRHHGSAGRKPTLLVLAIGETVRSANFGLSGYARQTTPELSQLDLLVYPRVQACGTSTEVSAALHVRPGRPPRLRRKAHPR